MTDNCSFSDKAGIYTLGCMQQIKCFRSDRNTSPWKASRPAGDKHWHQSASAIFAEPCLLLRHISHLNIAAVHGVCIAEAQHSSITTMGSTKIVQPTIHGLNSTDHIGCTTKIAVLHIIKKIVLH